ncbi:CBS domain-containing protein [Pyrobaculum calidifontis]|uniref:Signal transduction protein with CBS domains n=1 Tax=Pyrobaculum calidifontis (strain DSM 21063 / JCM 11548 / VA1) TaxID=410359 RepID=A3MWU5_PYRCJ|nr:CBS domain-containing protein [Pyrobaculum calidifontis]ABO09112.1 putative signal transduction protein with CBS domains [Pyrobaculum calidifontis JCM 11548]
MTLFDRPVAEFATKNVVTVSEKEKVLNAMKTMISLDIRRLPIVRGDKVVGIITMLDILDAIYSWLSDKNASGTLYSDIYMKSVAEVGTRSVVTVRPNTPVGEVISLFLRHNFGSMPIVDEEGRLVGIFTEWDVLKLASQLDFPHRVRDVMTRIVYVLTPYSTVMDVLEGITVYKFRRYPIVDESGKVVAMLHAKDVLRYFAEDETVEKIRQGAVEEVVNNYAINIAKSPIFLAKPSDPVIDVVRKMLEYDVGGVPVVNEEGTAVIGMVTEKTLLLLFEESQ